MRYLVIVIFLVVLAMGCHRRNPTHDVAHISQPAVVQPNHSIVYDTIAGYYGYSYDSLRNFLLAPLGKESLYEFGPIAYDTLLYENHVSKNFLVKAKEIENRHALASQLKLPPDAKIIEYALIKGMEVSDRAIALWIRNPRVQILNNEYVCPTVTTGLGYFMGRTYCSLVDTKNNTVINTLEVLTETIYNDSTIYRSELPIPFSIRNPEMADELGQLKYHAKGGTDTTDGIAEILFLEDYNGDGEKLEFAFYDQFGCMLCNSALFGYSKKQDKLMQYPSRLNFLYTLQSDEAAMKDTSSIETIFWVDHLFEFRVNDSGKVEFSIDYRGRGGSLDRYEVRYNAAGEMYEGTVDSRIRPEDESIPPSWYKVPEKKQ